MFFTQEEFDWLVKHFPGGPHGAYPDGTKVVKIDGEPGDVHAVGTKGVVVGSVYNSERQECGYAVEWETGVRGFVIGAKIIRQE